MENNCVCLCFQSVNFPKIFEENRENPLTKVIGYSILDEKETKTG